MEPISFSFCVRGCCRAASLQSGAKTGHSSRHRRRGLILSAYKSEPSIARQRSDSLIADMNCRIGSFAGGSCEVGKVSFLLEIMQVSINWNLTTAYESGFGRVERSNNFVEMLPSSEKTINLQSSIWSLLLDFGVVFCCSSISIGR